MYLALFPFDEQTCNLDVASCKWWSDNDDDDDDDNDDDAVYDDYDDGI